MNWDTRFAQPNEVSGAIYSFATHDDGTGPWLYLGGDFAFAGGVAAQGIARWNGANWGYFGQHAQGYPKALLFYDFGNGPTLFAAGTSDVTNVAWISYWTGTQWLWPVGTFGGSITGTRINALAIYDDGSGPALYAAGLFWRADIQFMSNIAKWDGTAWSPLGTASASPPGPGTNGEILALHVFDDGSGPALYATGYFTSAGGVPAQHIARWNGSTWSDVGGGVPVGPPVTMADFDDGHGRALYAPVPGGIGRWDGTQWTTIGDGAGGPLTGSICALAAYDDGGGEVLYAGGSFGFPGVGFYLAKWDGFSWSRPGWFHTGEVTAMAVYNDGLGRGPALYAGGYFLEAGTVQSRRLAAWHGCHEPIDTYCFGDGTVADCPCSNRGSRGHGCANSVASQGAKLVASGVTADDSLTLAAINEPQSSLTMVLQGDENLPGWNKFGDGLLCTGGQLLRMYTKSATNGSVVVPDVGDPTIRARAAERGDVLGSGAVRWYQAYYRDVSASYCPAPSGSTFNTTNGVRVVW